MGTNKQQQQQQQHLCTLVHFHSFLPAATHFEISLLITFILSHHRAKPSTHLQSLADSTIPSKIKRLSEKLYKRF